MDLVHPDACIINLESALTSRLATRHGEGGRFRTHPANLGLTKAANVAICALANDSVPAWGRNALDETVRSLSASHVRYAGTGANAALASAPAVLRMNGECRVIVHAFAGPDCGIPDDWSAGVGNGGVAVLRDLEEGGLRQAAAAVHSHRREGDLAVLSIHWGGERSGTVPDAHRRFARELIDRDLVDVVHGHSSHGLRPFEVHRGKLILYGCGDLVGNREAFGAGPEAARDAACLYFATLSQDSGRMVGFKVVPMQRRDGRLTWADSAARATIRRALGLSESSGGFSRRLVWRTDGHWLVAPFGHAPR